MADPTLEDRLRDVEDELYGIAPSDFVRHRDEAARAAKQDGARDLAEAISSLRKPTASAWALNSFVRRDNSGLDEVLAVGTRLRDAVDRGDGVAIRELMRERSRAIADVSAAVRRHADQLGSPLSASVGSQVEQTLRAAMVSEHDAGLLRRGVLHGALEESGTMSGPVRRPDGPAGDVPGAPSDDEQLEVAQRRVSTAEDAVTRIEREREESVARRTDLEASRDELRGRLDDVEQRLRDERDATSRIEAQLQDARAELRAARAAARRRS